MPDSAAAPVVARAAVFDAVAVLIFATTGRRSHAEGLTVGGIVETAWPFLVGAALGWLISFSLARKTGRDWDPSILAPAGVIIWVSTVTFGMLLRVTLTDKGTAFSFIIVASVATAVLLLGWRAVAGLIARRRAAA